MVAPILRLRLALLANTFRHPSRNLALVLLGIVLGAAAAVSIAWVPSALSADNAVLRADLDTVTSAFVLGLAFVLPLFMNRSHLEPRQFAGLPASPRSIAFGLLLSTVLTWPFLFVCTWLIALTVFRPDWWSAPWAMVLGMLGTLVLAALLGRTASGASKLIFASERAADVRGVLGATIAVAVLPLLFFVVSSAIGDGLERSAADTAAVVGWTPFGAALRGLDLAAAGDLGGALGRFALMLLSIVVLLALWVLVVRVSMQRIDRPVAIGLARSGLGWFERFSARPSSLIGARTVTYWLRDPRYRVALLAIPFAPVVMVIAMMVAGAPHQVLALIPLPVICLLLSWSIHNDVATDATAIWIHVASGIKGRDDRFGRVVPVLLLGIPVVLIGSSITVAVFGDWRPLPAVIGMSAAVLLIGCGVSSVASALSPYPTTRPGDSPFVQPQWSGSGSALAQTISMAASVVLALPPVWVALSAITEPTFAVQIGALVFGLVYGAFFMFVGVLVGGRVFDRNAPELLAVAQMFD